MFHTFYMKNKASDPWKLCSRLSETIILPKSKFSFWARISIPKSSTIHSTCYQNRSQNQEKRSWKWAQIHQNPVLAPPWPPNGTPRAPKTSPRPLRDAMLVTFWTVSRHCSTRSGPFSEDVSKKILLKIAYGTSNNGRQQYEKKQNASSTILDPMIVCFGLAGFPKGLQ